MVKKKGGASARYLGFGISLEFCLLLPKVVKPGEDAESDDYLLRLFQSGSNVAFAALEGRAQHSARFLVHLVGSNILWIEFGTKLHLLFHRSRVYGASRHRSGRGHAGVAHALSKAGNFTLTLEKHERERDGTRMGKAVELGSHPCLARNDYATSLARLVWSDDSRFVCCRVGVVVGSHTRPRLGELVDARGGVHLD